MLETPLAFLVSGSKRTNTGKTFREEGGRGSVFVVDTKSEVEDTLERKGVDGGVSRLSFLGPSHRSHPLPSFAKIYKVRQQISRRVSDAQLMPLPPFTGPSLVTCRDQVAKRI